MDLNKRRLYQLTKQDMISGQHADAYREVMKRHIALHCTDHLTPYLSLRARSLNFDPNHLFEALSSGTNAVKIRAFRGTLFVIHRELLTEIYSAARLYQSSNWRAMDRFFEKNSVEYGAVIDLVHEAIYSAGSLPVKEIKQRIQEKFDIQKEFLSYLIRYLEFKCIIVRTGARYLTDRTARFGLMHRLFPETEQPAFSAEEALKRIMMRYIRQFGPVTLDDISWWFPLSKSKAGEVIRDLGESITTIDHEDRVYFMETDDHRRFADFMPASVKGPVINFLPYEDHFPKAYKIRDWYLSDAMLPKLIHVRGVEYGQLRPSIWIDGRIVGRWEHGFVDKGKTRMEIDIIELEDEVESNSRLSGLITCEKNDLLDFINSRLIPLMRKKS
jgi:hypothetical protein